MSKSIEEFFDDLLPIQKTFFLVTLCEMAKEDKLYIESLRNIVSKTLNSSNNILKGFSISISQDRKLNLNIEKTFLNADYVKNIFTSNDLFLRIKFLQSFSYNEIKEYIDREVLTIITDSNNYLEIKSLIGSIENIDDINYLLETTVKKIISKTFLINPDLSKLFIRFKSTSNLFKEIENFLVSDFNYQKLNINYIEKLIFDSNMYSVKEEFESIAQFYEKEIVDIELKRNLLSAIGCFQESLLLEDNDFDRTHSCVARINQCFLYEKTKEIQNYNYVEKIPKSLYENKLHLTKKQLNELADSNVLAYVDSSIDTDRNTVSLKYFINKDLYKSPKEVNNKNHNEIEDLLTICCDLYEKSLIYYDLTGRIPYIKKENVLFDYINKKAIFKSIGGSLVEQENFENLDKLLPVIYSKKEEIPALIGIVIKDIVFHNQIDEYKEFEKNKKDILDFFISYLINVLIRDNKEKCQRIIQKRFNFLVLEYCQSQNKMHFLLREKLKTLIYYDNDNKTKWDNIVKSLSYYYGSIHDVIKIHTHCKNLNNQKDFKELHYTSSLLMNIVNNYKEIFSIDEDSELKKDYKLFELLNYYSILCIETMSFLRFINLLKGNYINDLSLSETKLKYNTHEIDVSNIIGEIHTLLNKAQNKKDIFDAQEYIDINLESLVCMFLLFSTEWQVYNNEININSMLINKNLRTEDYFCNFILRLFKIDDGVTKIINTIKTDLCSPINQYDYEILINEIKEYLENINKCRHKLKLQRKRYTISKEDNFSDEYWYGIIPKRMFGAQNFLSCPLTSIIPSNQKSSIDMYKNKVFNVVATHQNILNFVKIFNESFEQKIKDFYIKKKRLLDIIVVIVVIITLVSLFLLAKSIDFQSYKINIICSLSGALCLFIVHKIIANFEH